MKTRNGLTDLAHRLVLHAARKAPAVVAERLEEEWLADLESRPRSLSRLRLALGCCWATAVITRDFRVPQMATAGGVSGPRAALGDLQHSLPQLSRRTLTFILIAGFHVLVFYFFASGLAQHVVAALPQAILATFPVEIRPQPQPVAATPVYKPRDFANWDPPVAGPPNIEYPPDEAPATQGGGGDGTAAHETVVAPPALHRVVGGPGTGFPSTDDYYPATSRRMQETGAATVQVCVDRLGRLTADPTLTRSSGSRRIDDGALNLAKAGSGHYRPTTEDGQPVNSCYPYRIRFQLN